MNIYIRRGAALVLLEITDLLTSHYNEENTRSFRAVLGQKSQEKSMFEDKN
jgi:hypothetical protein